MSPRRAKGTSTQARETQTGSSARELPQRMGEPFEEVEGETGSEGLSDCSVLMANCCETFSLTGALPTSLRRSRKGREGTGKVLAFLTGWFSYRLSRIPPSKMMKPDDLCRE